MLRADLDAIYAGETVTVINRLDARHTEAKADQWLATELDGCRWSESEVRTVQADGTVAVGVVRRVKIPESDAFMPYRLWRESPAGGWTLRSGDYVVRGRLSQAVDASNVRDVVASHEPDAFQVRAFRDTTKRGGLGGPRGGVLRFAEGYSVEG